MTSSRFSINSKKHAWIYVLKTLKHLQNFKEITRNSPRRMHGVYIQTKHKWQVLDSEF